MSEIEYIPGVRLRYIVRGTDHAQDEPDTISRPEVFDTKANKSVGERWYLNDWDRAERFATEMNDIEIGDS